MPEGDLHVPARRRQLRTTRTPQARQLTGEVRVRLAGRETGRWALPHSSTVTLGRRAGAGIRLPETWVSGELARLEPVEGAWLLRNGLRTRAVITSRWLSATAQPGAVVRLEPASWTVAWDLDAACEATISIARATGAPVEPARLALDSFGQERGLVPVVGTVVAGHAVGITPAVRHKLAVLYRHLIVDEPTPANIVHAAAAALGMRDHAVKNTALRVRDRINAHRGSDIVTLEHLGYYLVHTAQVISADDLDP